jgi:hypothetical protein
MQRIDHPLPWSHLPGTWQAKVAGREPIRVGKLIND